ncbi:MAG: hypothetical protein R3F61_07805 [Myxococcota bacterium]
MIAVLVSIASADPGDPVQVDPRSIAIGDTEDWERVVALHERLGRGEPFAATPLGRYQAATHSLDHAEAVVLATVVDANYREVAGRLYSLTTFRVDRRLKGDVTDRFVVVSFGYAGELPDGTTIVLTVPVPWFAVQESVILAVNPLGERDAPSALSEATHTLFSPSAAAWARVSSPDGQPDWVRASHGPVNVPMSTLAEGAMDYRRVIQPGSTEARINAVMGVEPDLAANPYEDDASVLRWNRFVEWVEAHIHQDGEGAPSTEVPAVAGDHR